MPSKQRNFREQQAEKNKPSAKLWKEKQDMWWRWCSSTQWAWSSNRGEGFSCKAGSDWSTICHEICPRCTSFGSEHPCDYHEAAIRNHSDNSLTDKNNKKKEQTLLKEQRGAETHHENLGKTMKKKQSLEREIIQNTSWERSNRTGACSAHCQQAGDFVTPKKLVMDAVVDHSRKDDASATTNWWQSSQ